MLIYRCRNVFSPSQNTMKFSTKVRELTNTSNEAVRQRRNKMYEEEQARQLALITRIEKVQVNVKGPPEECQLIMNKGLSTPYNCAMHINTAARDRSVLAIVNGKPWDMHRPLLEDCELKFVYMTQEDPRLANKTYWRSCSFLLGLLAEKAFRENFYVELHSWPSPDIHSGSYVYDVDLKMKDWKPTKEELRVMSMLARKTCAQNLKFERLQVDASVALALFADNQYKREQIPRIAANSPTGTDVTLYRVGDHVDISRGPMISSTSHVGPYNVSAVYCLTTDYGLLYRFQGVSIPQDFRVNHFIWNVLVERSRKVNPSRVPSKPTDNIPLEMPMHKS